VNSVALGTPFQLAFNCPTVRSGSSAQYAHGYRRLRYSCICQVVPSCHRHSVSYLRRSSETECRLGEQNLFASCMPRQVHLWREVGPDHIRIMSVAGDSKIVPLDTRRGAIAELCWLSVSPDDRLIYATVFGYSNLTTFHIDGLEIRVAKDPACPVVEGDGHLPRALRRHQQRTER
jgi:hypothetical protein